MEKFLFYRYDKTQTIGAVITAAESSRRTEQRTIMLKCGRHKGLYVLLSDRQGSRSSSIITSIVPTWTCVGWWEVRQCNRRMSQKGLNAAVGGYLMRIYGKGISPLWTDCNKFARSDPSELNFLIHNRLFDGATRRRSSEIDLSIYFYEKFMFAKTIKHVLSSRGRKNVMIRKLINAHQLLRLNKIVSNKTGRSLLLRKSLL